MAAICKVGRLLALGGTDLVTVLKGRLAVWHTASES